MEKMGENISMIASIVFHTTAKTCFEFIHSFYLIVLEIFFYLRKQKGEVYNLPMPLNLQSSKLNIEMFL